MTLIYIAQFDTNGILTALYTVMKYIQTHCMYTYMDTYKQSYSYTDTSIHIDIYTDACTNISRVPGQNCVSLLYIMLEIHHSGLEPSNYAILTSLPITRA